MAVEGYRQARSRERLAARTGAIVDTFMMVRGSESIRLHASRAAR